jgi:hypothetical protein
LQMQGEAFCQRVGAKHDLVHSRAPATLCSTPARILR